MKIRRKSIPPVSLSLAILAVATTAVVYSPTLYRLFCEATGYGGTVSVSKSLKPEDHQDNIGPEVTVRFDANTSPGLQWEFEPEQRQVKTHIGVPTTVYYRAKNVGDHTIVGRATYNVTPGSAGYYFNKTECFCFTEQPLASGESVEMPVVFFVDPDMDKDPKLKHIKEITLSYTFFPAKQPETPVAARPDATGTRDNL